MTSALHIRDDQLELPSSAKAVDEIVFMGGDKAHCDEPAFLATLAHLDSRESIRHIKVDVHSNLTSCRFLAHFPGVETLTLAGQSIVSTAGLHAAKSLRKLFMLSGTKNKMRLDELDQSRISVLEIRAASLDDIEMIARAATLDKLQFSGGALTDLAMLGRSKAKALTLVHGKLDGVVDVRKLAQVEELWLESCTKLAGFADVDQSIRQLTISACNKLDFRSVAKLQALELVTIMSCRQEILLEDFNGLGRLRYLALTNCKVDTADSPLLNPGGLKKIWISPAKDGFVRRLSERNPGILVCNGNATYLGGRALPVADFYN